MALDHNKRLARRALVEILRAGDVDLADELVDLRFARARTWRRPDRPRERPQHRDATASRLRRAVLQAHRALGQPRRLGFAPAARSAARLLSCRSPLTV